ncbi:MAG: cation diffusion facilitator family transporter [Elusimicrobia bacterium]|nr:cation diffusion facilitator family transporter [Candidatus Obscuribacterium magneticum]
MSGKNIGVEDKCVRCANRLAWVGLFDSFFLAVFKGVAGILTHSRALTMSAVYSLHDVISEVAILFGLKVASAPANEEHPYGHGDMENVVSIFNGLIIFGATIFLLFESVGMLLKGQPAPLHWTALGAAVIATVANELIYRYDICAYRHINSPAMLTHARHHRADAVSSLAAVVAIFGAKMGWYFLDALVAVFEAGHLLYLSGEILFHAGGHLLDRSSDEEVVTSIEEITARVAGQQITKNVKARHIGRFLNVDLYLGLPLELSLSDAEGVAERIRYALKRRIKHIGNVNIIYE